MTQRFSKLNHIQYIIANSKYLSHMPQDTKLLSKLNAGIKGLLGGQLADHCQIGKLENNILVYYVDSPIWAYTFKIAKNNIINMLNDLGKQYQNSENAEQREFAVLSNITDIQIRVRPSITRPKPYKKHRAPLPKFSQEIAKSIEETAETLQDKEVAELWRQFGQKHSQKEPKEMD